MPDRIVRDELLDSDRYWSLPSDTHRMLFAHFMLTADDCGNAEATDRIIRQRLIPGRHGVARPEMTDQAIAKMLAEMAETDIVRPYLADGKRYVHIPRFRQRLRSYRRVNPRPPAAIEDNEIKELLDNLSGTCRTGARQMTGRSQSLAVKEGRKEEVQKPITSSKQNPVAAVPVDNSLHGSSTPIDIRSKAHHHEPLPEREHRTQAHVNGQPTAPRTLSQIVATDWGSSQAGIASMTAALELRPKPGETWQALADRCRAALIGRQHGSSASGAGSA